MTKYGPTALILCLSLVGCERPVDKDGNNVVNAADNAANMTMAANDSDNAAQPPRSILRPDVVEPQETPKIEPAETMIGFGSSTMRLDDAAKVALDALLATPAMKAGGAVTLRGHSDSRGTDGDNRVASRIRAERVRDYLVEKGVAKDRITLIALGETRPLVPNAKEDGSDDPDGRAKNRRVEIIVTPPAEAPAPAETPAPAEKE